MKKKLEVCVDVLESVFIAEKMGADRVELCSSLSLDGLTPSYGMMKVAALASVPIYAMIRPRSGNFIYTDKELEWMHEDIYAAYHTGIDGVVFGCLNVNSSFDKEAMRSLYKAAKSKNLGVTIHRAFDAVNDPFEALDFLMELGVERLLTSGQKQTALEGADLLFQLVQYSSNRISIMAGSGVNPENLRECIKKTNAHEFHFSARKTSKALSQNTNTINNVEADKPLIADGDLILRARHILDECERFD